MTLSTILLQLEALGIKAKPDTTTASQIQDVADAAKAHADSLTNLLVQPGDSVPSISPGRLATAVTSIDWGNIITSLSSQFISFALRLAIALLVFYIGKFIINKIHSIVGTIMVSKDVDRSLTTFVLSLVKITLMFILIIVVIGILGIETSSFIAIFASAGVAIGMALSGTLQNFAGGVLILLIKPYKIGDYIEFGNFKGHVKEIQIFHTIIINYNNERIIIPNGGLSTGTINNYSAEKYRRCQWQVALAYGDDVELARKVAFEIIDADPRVIKKSTDAVESTIELEEEAAEAAAAEAAAHEEETTTNDKPWWKRIFAHTRNKTEELKAKHEAKVQAFLPKKNFSPSVNLESLDDSSITIVIRAWAAASDYWGVLYSVNEQIYKQFPERGLHFPFPQLDVHVNQVQ